MNDLAAIDRELDGARKSDDNRALVRLISRALALPEAQPFLAEYLDELAYAYQELGCFDEAIDAMRRALAAGWDGELDDHPSAEALIADLLLRAGRTQEGDEAWLQAERQTPRDPSLHYAAVCAYATMGLPSFAEDYEHGPYAAYCARLELLLPRRLRHRDGPDGCRPALAATA